MRLKRKRQGKATEMSYYIIIQLYNVNLRDKSGYNLQFDYVRESATNCFHSSIQTGQC